MTEQEGRVRVQEIEAEMANLPSGCVTQKIINGMVVYDKQENCCDVYEIKHSDKMVLEQTKHLVEEEKIALTERRFGEVRGRYVLYRGEAAENEKGILYKNAVDYLKGLPGTAMIEDVGRDIDVEEGHGWKYKM